MISNHRLTSATQSPSINYNDRPNGEISLIVIHNISLPPGEFNNPYIEQFFTNQLDFNAHPYFKTIQDLQVSSHLLIKRDGSIIQFIPFDKRAWHAGESSFNGQDNCNDFSIGIELEGTDNLNYEAVQYQSLKTTLKQLKNYYSVQNIVGHSDIAPGRKTDPGEAFNWGEIKD
ncbi:MAG TPA: 1,6-anhydro-N-acetylmuramyl-L-alanine amidase AmpD [Gammaproteobacteria bacterium]|nr:1,6-anhydro-N-acetylmuramyl-L-alanine amidase AmpD [Gammaproteobacteria bacterium]